MVTLGTDMRTTMMKMKMMMITSLVRSLEICLLVVKNQAWRFRILETEMIPERW
jgi:hypothetical protein